MRVNILFRLILAVFLGAVGVLIAKAVPPPELFAATGDGFYILAALAFGILGFISPDLLKLAGKAGVAALASQIADHLPVKADINVPRIFPGRKKAFGRYSNPMIVDTSALIDGRLIDVCQTGFIFGTFIIIHSVIDELHKLADSANDVKRVRGRRGLDNLNKLQKEKKVKVVVLSREPQGAVVDEKLVKIAKSLRAKIVTVDFNLNKVAKVNRITVLNINELVNAVKTPILPQDNLTIKILAIGKERDQGVGYLDDGTMVVVEDGVKLVGKFANVTVSKVIQTAAGKMIFGKVDESVNR